jgi:putative membrane protein
MYYIGLTFIFIAAIIHVYIWILESFLWTKPKTRRVFGLTVNEAKTSKLLAFNQGFYNLFLAIIVLVGIALFLTKNWVPGYVLIIAGAGSMVLAGSVLFLSDLTKVRATLIQVSAPILGIILISLL